MDELSYDQRVQLRSFNIFPKILKFFDSKTMHKQKCSHLLLHVKTSDFLIFISILLSSRNYFIANISTPHKCFQCFHNSPSRFVTDKSFHTIELSISNILSKNWQHYFQFFSQSMPPISTKPTPMLSVCFKVYYAVFIKFHDFQSHLTIMYFATELFCFIFF